MQQTERKREQNRKYYETHPERREKAREHQRKLRSALKPCNRCNMGLRRPQMPQEANFITRKWFRMDTVFLSVLVACLTLFLLREMYLFYLEGGQSKFWAFLQAALGEAVILSFSTFRGTTWSESIPYRGLVLALCVFSIYTVSIRQIGIKLQTVRQDQLALETISGVKQAILEKMAERDRYLSANLVWPARKVQRDLDSLRKELKLRMDQVVVLRPAEVSNRNLIAELCFRILVLTANILAVRWLMMVKTEISIGVKEKTESFSPVSAPQTKFMTPQEAFYGARKEKQVKQFQPSFSQKMKLRVANWISEGNSAPANF